MNIIKTTWRIERLAMNSPDIWTIKREGDKDEDVALEWLEWYRTHSNETYRLVKTIEIIIDKQDGSS